MGGIFNDDLCFLHFVVHCSQGRSTTTTHKRSTTYHPTSHRTMTHFGQVEDNSDALNPTSYHNLFIETHLRSFRDLLYDTQVSKLDHYVVLEARCGVLLDQILGTEQQTEAQPPLRIPNLTRATAYIQQFKVYIEDIRCLLMIPSHIVDQLAITLCSKLSNKTTNFDEMRWSIGDALIFAVLALGKLYEALLTSSFGTVPDSNREWFDKGSSKYIQLAGKPGIEYLEVARHVLGRFMHSSDVSCSHAHILVALYYTEVGCVKNGLHMRIASQLIQDRFLSLYGICPGLSLSDY